MLRTFCAHPTGHQGVSEGTAGGVVWLNHAPLVPSRTPRFPLGFALGAGVASSNLAVPTSGNGSAMRLVPVEATYALADDREAIANAARNGRYGKVLFALR